MASKINTDNPKHHKYISVNKQERKKITIDNINYNKINILNLKSFLQILEAILIENLDSIFIRKAISSKYREPNYHSAYHNEGVHSIHHGTNAEKGTRIVYNDCNHKTFRVIKNGKYISNGIKEITFNSYKYDKHDGYRY